MIHLISSMYNTSNIKNQGIHLCTPSIKIFLFYILASFWFARIFFLKITISNIGERLLFNLFKILCTLTPGHANWRATNVLGMFTAREQRKHTKRMSHILLQFFWKISFRPFFSSSFIFFSFLIHFEWFKTWWNLGFTKLLSISEAKMQPPEILSSKS